MRTVDLRQREDLRGTPFSIRPNRSLRWAVSRPHLQLTLRGPVGDDDARHDDEHEHDDGQFLHSGCIGHRTPPSSVGVVRTASSMGSVWRLVLAVWLLWPVPVGLALLAIWLKDRLRRREDGRQQQAT